MIPMEEAIKISIIIVCNNTRLFTEQCLYSVSAATYGLEAEIFVIDNNSADKAAEYLSPLFPNIEFVKNKETLSEVEIHSTMLSKTVGEYVLLLNSHVLIGEDCIRTICYFMDEHSDVGAVGPEILDIHGNFIPESKRCFPSFWTSFCKAMGLSLLFPNSARFNKYYLPYLDKNKKHRVDVISSSFMMLRRSAVETVGWPEEASMQYEEDIEIASRLAAREFKCYYLPERILHYGKSVAPVKSKRRRLLIIAYEENAKEVKTACTKQMPEFEFINLWDLNDNRIMDAISRSNQMKGFTDIVVCYPDVRFEQFMLFMDKMPSKSITYHIYNKKSGTFLFPEE